MSHHALTGSFAGADGIVVMPRHLNCGQFVRPNAMAYPKDRAKKDLKGN
jgi:hypothetical protein